MTKQVTKKTLKTVDIELDTEEISTIIKLLEHEVSKLYGVEFVDKYTGKTFKPASDIYEYLHHKLTSSFNRIDYKENLMKKIGSKRLFTCPLCLAVNITNVPENYVFSVDEMNYLDKHSTWWHCKKCKSKVERFRRGGE